MNIDGTPPPAPTGEDKEWADLAAEVDGEVGEEAAADGHGEGGGDKQASSTDTPTPDATAEQPKQQPIPYEELERRHRQTAGALKETREREQAARDQLKAFTNMVEEMRSQRKAPAAEDTKQPDPEIDPNEDPIGYFQQRIAKLEAQLTETHKSATETREEARSRQEYQSFLGEVSKHEDAFKATTPDYHDAAEYLEKGRRAELQVMFPDSEHFNRYAQQQGYKSAAHLREAIFVNDAQTVARNALMAGMNPAEAYYELAKGRGYKPGGGGGGAPEAKVPTANGVIDAMRRGTKASKTLSGGGGSPDNPLNIADLTDLYAEDPEEFDKQWEKMARAGKLG